MQTENHFSTWQNKFVPTYILSPKTDAKSKSLSDLVQFLPPYSRVELSTGQYTEQLLISKPLEIVLAGEGEIPEIACRPPCITITAEAGCYMEGITVAAKVVSSVKKDRETPAVLITAGKPVIVRCTLPSLRVTGESKPTFRECHIVGSSGVSGIAIVDQGGGEFEGCDIRDHHLYCIEILGGGDPVFRNSTIRSSKEQEKVILIAGSSKVGTDSSECSPVFDSNDIGWGTVPPALTPLSTDNAQMMVLPDDMLYLENAVVMVMNKCSPHFINNRIEGGKIGVMLGKGASARFENDRIARMYLWGVFVCHYGTSQFVSTEITQCGGGIRAENCTQHMKFTQCNVHENQTYGVMVLQGGDPFLKECNLSTNAKGGLYIKGGGCGLFVENTMSRNDEYGVVIQGSLSNPVIRGARILCNKIGMIVSKGAAPMVAESVISMNKKHGVFVSKSAAPIIESTHVTKSAQHNMIFSERARGTVTRCDVDEAGECGIVVSGGSNPMVKGCAISKNRGPGVACSERGNGIFEGCEIGIMEVGVLVEALADPMFVANKIRTCSRVGLLVKSEGLGTFLANFIINSKDNVIVTTDSEPVLRRNFISEAELNGIQCIDRSFATVEYNIFKESGVCNVLLTGESCNSLVRRNEIRDSKGYGVLCTMGAKCAVTQNLLTNNAKGGLCCSKMGAGDFVRNVSWDEVGPAIRCFDEGAGKFHHNVITKGKTHGALITNATPQISHCSFAECVVGIEVGEHAGGEIKESTFKDNTIALLISSCTTSLVESCSLTFSKECAVKCLSGTSFVMKTCEVSENDIGFILLNAGPNVHKATMNRNRVSVHSKSGGSATFSQCTFTDGIDCFVLLEEGGDANFMDCLLQGAPEGVVCDASLGVLQKCTLTKSDIGLRISNDGKLSVRESTVSEGRLGAYFLSNSFGELTQSSLTGHSEFGVLIEEAADPKLTQNTISACLTGLCIRNDGKGTVMSNEILSNDDGILISHKGCPAVTKNRILNNKGNGIVVQHDARGLLDGNIIMKNLRSGVHITYDVMQVVVSNNEVKENEEHGFFIGNGTTCVIKANQCTRNSPTNCFIDDSAPVVVENEFSLGLRHGVVLNGTGGTFAHNKVLKNKSYGIQCISTITAQVMANTISENEVNVLFSEESTAHFENNYLTESISGIMVQKNARPVIVQNRFGIGIMGIKLLSGAAGKISDNYFSHGTIGVLYEGKDISTIVAQNDFSHCVESAILVRGNDTAVIHKNIFRDNETGIKLAHSTSVVRSNSFLGGKIGLWVEGAEPTVEANTFECCEKGLFIYDTTSAPKVSENLLKKCEIGIHTVCGGGTVCNNTFVGNTAAGICFEAVGTTEAHHNVIFDHHVGVHFRQGGAGVFRMNDVHGCDFGAYIEEKSGGSLQQNIIHHCRKNGVYIVGEAAPTISGNVLLRNGSSDLFVDGEANPRVEGNLFQFSDCGVSVGPCGKGVFQGNVLHFCHVGLRAQSVIPGCKFSQNFVFECITGVLVHTNGVLDVVRNLFEKCSAAMEVTTLANPNVGMNTFRENCEGIVVCAEGCGHFEANLVTQCQRQAFLVVDGSAPEFCGNDIADCCIGVLFDKESRGIFKKNHVHKCQKNGVIFVNGASPHASENVIFACEIGCHINEGSSVNFSSNTVFGNHRIGCCMESSVATVANNHFFSTQEGGAFQNTRPSNKLVQNNENKNKSNPSGFSHTCLSSVSVPHGMSMFAMKKLRAKILSEVCSKNNNCALVDPAWEYHCRIYIASIDETGAGRPVIKVFDSPEDPLQKLKAAVIGITVVKEKKKEPPPPLNPIIPPTRAMPDPVSPTMASPRTKAFAETQKKVRSPLRPPNLSSPIQKEPVEAPQPELPETARAMPSKKKTYTTEFLVPSMMARVTTAPSGRREKKRLAGDASLEPSMLDESTVEESMAVTRQRTPVKLALPALASLLNLTEGWCQPQSSDAWPLTSPPNQTSGKPLAETTTRKAQSAHVVKSNSLLPANVPRRPIKKPPRPQLQVFNCEALGSLPQPQTSKTRLLSAGSPTQVGSPKTHRPSPRSPLPLPNAVAASDLDVMDFVKVQRVEITPSRPCTGKVIPAPTKVRQHCYFLDETPPEPREIVGYYYNQGSVMRFCPAYT